ncbi:FMN reductase [Gordonia pseudamarae]|jgi:NAD(P)H-dependent FMN reductase|uniref:FMN reductase n=1 Tax=Gordonia pseudamarae TaxID=2831662 RepID=A0ABX6IL66_9ACTN|nr:MULTISPECIES: NAD(P)H-dependent oxidoreductase [Gordonia]MBD0023150.1 NAD(P)H-dependent oxidoreductase [Gordonia sp. (in: high G+C Gram-positive bacteria)]QHN27135.1 FMN reductase [Gordonia pseudamarae]QHN36025.1 FMN reductase [Gordonia pseudamarae]
MSQDSIENDQVRPAKVVALVGSLRQASVNRQLAQVAADNAPDGVRVSVIDTLGALPFYNEDTDPSVNPAAGEVDAQVAGLRTVVADADAVLIVTPEHNGSIPAALKNAIDWLSRPYGTGAIKGKPVGVIGAALGQYAGTWSRTETRKSVGIAGGQVVEEVEVGINSSKLGEQGVSAPEVVEQVVGAVTRLTGEVAAAV